MTRLEILATDESPKVIFDPERGILEIAGKSLPEDTKEFYNPIITMAQSYIKNPKPHTIINLSLVYLNSSSTKKVLELVTYFEEIEKKGFTVELNWFYQEHDEDMLEEGEEFERLTDLKVKFIEIPENQQ